MNLRIKTLSGCLVLCALGACGGGEEQRTELRQSVSDVGPYEPPPSLNRMPDRPRSETESATL